MISSPTRELDNVISLWLWSNDRPLPMMLPFWDCIDWYIKTTPSIECLLVFVCALPHSTWLFCRCGSVVERWRLFLVHVLATCTEGAYHTSSLRERVSYSATWHVLYTCGSMSTRNTRISGGLNWNLSLLETSLRVFNSGVFWSARVLDGTWKTFTLNKIYQQGTLTYSVR